MPNILPKADKPLNAAFNVVLSEDGQTMQALCKGKTADGEDCIAEWECELDQEGGLFRGTYNSLMAHARAHDDTQRKRMRRLR